MRPYNSLPRGQDVNNYPSLAAHQTSRKGEHKGKGTPVTGHKQVSTSRHHSPARRAHSEDVYAERKTESTQTEESHPSGGLMEEVVEKTSMEVHKGKAEFFYVFDWINKERPCFNIIIIWKIQANFLKFGWKSQVILSIC